MIRQSMLVVAAVAAFSLPAVAATEHWVAKNETTKKCEVVSKKPDGKTLMEIGKKSYESKAAAEKAMKTAAECK